ncbi:MAG: hypothetical protein O3B01_24520 [Planctomycetota bacterium]|nr:hypothetical protein [Planctomycetota bacterium]
MLDKTKRQRFQYLREREEKECLAEDERKDLAGLIEEIEQAEAAYLEPAIGRMRKENEKAESRLRALEDLARRKEELLKRMKALQAERSAIQEETERLLGQKSGVETAV